MLRLYGVLLAGLTAVAVAVGISLGVAAPAQAASTIKVCGSGYGHGVGLSQYGAYGRAKSGQGYATIIKVYYKGVSLKKFSNNPNVRVLLGSSAFSNGHKIVIPSQSKGRLRNLATGGTVALSPSTYRVTYLSGKRLYRVTNVSAGKRVGSYTGPVAFERVSGGLPRFGGKPYRGRYEARARDSKLMLVNRLRMEGYLKGVVPNEMPASWDQAALRSQAVAARSFAWATRRGGAFDFYPDTRDQVYGGASTEAGGSNRAVKATERIVATYGDKAITAFFHSSAGGYTEDAAYVFNSTPYLKAKKDVDSKGRNYEAKVNSPWTRWSGTIDRDGSPNLGVGTITGVRVLDRSPSGRATKVRVKGTKGEKILRGQYDIRYGLKTNGLERADGSTFPAGDLPSARVSFGSACG
jgi:stage II sporulation protein D